MLRVILARFSRPGALVLLLVLTVALSAAERLSCHVSPWPGGLFRYELRPAPAAACRNQCWEDQNKTVLTQGLDFDPDLVHNVSRDALVLRRCLSHAHFLSQCHGFVEARCSFDCSSVPTVSDGTGPSNNVTIIIVAVLLFLLLAIAALCCFYRYKKRRSQKDLTRGAEELQEPLGGSIEPDAPHGPALAHVRVE